MFNTQSDYALNKLDKDAIVCPSATGVHIRLTREDFASEEEFLRWKVWSDGDYHDIEKAGRGYYDYCISLSEAGTTGISAEDIFIAPLLEAEQEERRAALLRQVKGLLTKTQYRRLCLYYLEGKTEEEIAVIEGVKQQRISKSLIAGKKFVEKIFKEFLENRG